MIFRERFTLRINLRKNVFFLFIAIMTTVVFILSSCTDDISVEPETLIGDEGIIFARSVATRFPVRSAGSVQERAVGNLIVTELKKMGYQPAEKEFPVGDSVSRNISVIIPGEGFSEEPESGVSAEPVIFHRKAVIGVHYDTPVDNDFLTENPSYDGINDNASAVGALIAIAKTIRTRRYQYDIELVFFGAGNLDFAGARYYVSGLKKAEISDIDVMYCIDSIYAGDKLYAHSGINSLEPGKKYLRRRKLYELSDVAIANRIDLRFNESDLDLDLNGDDLIDVYREVTKEKSDYSVFDDIGISCVFIESFEYFASAEKDQMESKNPYFGETGGIIRGTKYDSSEYLGEVLEEGRLETRIKNVAFLIVSALEKGVYR